MQTDRINDVKTPGPGSSHPTRRSFLQNTAVTGAAAAVAASALFPSGVYAQSTDVIKVGLVGAGGRGSGAALNALNGDKNAQLVAVGDMFPDKLQDALKNLRQSDVGKRVMVDPDSAFSGFDAYKHVIEKSDVVLLATPPHFRPMHFKAAVEAGKHVFVEKPVAVDVPGLKSVMETAAKAKEKNLSVVSGLCYRYDVAKQDVIKRIHDGQLGEIQTLQGNYLTGGLWSNPRKAEWTDMEWQLRNWLYFTWLSGDHIVEQHVHTVDKMLWVMKDVAPVKAIASGGRTVRTAYPEFGNIYDHFNVQFEWENGVRGYMHSRQWVNCAADTSDFAIGTKGTANIMQHRITGEKPWRRAASPVNMYDAEHVQLFKAIRSNAPINNGDYMVKATMMGIIGRMSAYTGQALTWEKAMESTESLSPPNYAMGPLPTPPIPVPGQTKFT